jgi:hypothetical protein
VSDVEIEEPIQRAKIAGVSGSVCAPLVMVKWTLLVPVKRSSMVAAGTRLLVLPRAREEHRHVDVVHEGRRRHRVGELGVIEVVLLDHLDDVGDCTAQAWCRCGSGRPASMALRDHGWPPGCASLALGGPVGREAVVQDAARVERAASGVGDDRQRRDRLQRRRRCSCATNSS